MRRHGWQRPLHPLQIVGIAVYSALAVTFYTFLGLFLGNKIAIITVVSIFSFVAFSVMVLFIRCTALDPTDKTSSRRKRRAKSKGVPKLNYGLVFSQLVVRFFRRVERKILRSFIKRTYLDPWKSTVQMEPLLPFPLVMKDDAVTPEPKEEDDISYCSICDFEVKRSSKHCRTCNRCVEGFDHHCRWLNNCVGKRNYTAFILLMTFVLSMLIIEGGTALAIFVRCFADKKGIEMELKRRLFLEFPAWLLATISVLVVLVTAYGSAAMGQLFFFHLVLIRKGIRTYDYILAMKEENELAELDPFDDSDSSSDESSDFDHSPERSKPAFISRFICGRHGSNQDPQRLSIRIDEDPSTSNMTNKKPGFRASINPWKLIKLSREKALLAAEKARERLRVRKEQDSEQESIKPLPLETKVGPLDNGSSSNSGSTLTPLFPMAKLQVSPGKLSSPRRRFSGSSGIIAGVSPSPKQKYRSNFDLKLTEVSRELETYISRQVLCSVIKQDGSEASPR